MFVVSSLTLLASGCAQQTQPVPVSGAAVKPAPVQATPAPAPAEQRFSIAGGSPGGAQYIVATTMADVLTRKVPGVRITAQTTGAAIENANLVGTKQALIGLVSQQPAVEAYQNIGDFKGKNLTNVRAITPGYTAAIFLVVRKESTIKWLNDVRGKNVVVGPAGSGLVQAAEGMLKANGIALTDFKAQYLSMTAGGEALSNRQIDGMFVAGGIQAGTRSGLIANLATTADIRFVEFSDEELKKTNSLQPYSVVWTVPGIFPEVRNEPYKTVALTNMALTYAEADPDLIYTIVKTLYENREEMGKVHPANFEYTEKNDIKNIPIPLHPGAERYYKEQGWIK